MGSLWELLLYCTFRNWVFFAIVMEDTEIYKCISTFRETVLCKSYCKWVNIGKGHLIRSMAGLGFVFAYLKSTVFGYQIWLELYILLLAENKEVYRVLHIFSHRIIAVTQQLFLRFSSLFGFFWHANWH